MLGSAATKPLTLDLFGTPSIGAASTGRAFRRKAWV
jgi:hypothetical protein